MYNTFSTKGAKNEWKGKTHHSQVQDIFLNMLLGTINAKTPEFQLATSNLCLINVDCIIIKAGVGDSANMQSAVMKGRLIAANAFIK